jgi:hypothetical protein
LAVLLGTWAWVAALLLAVPLALLALLDIWVAQVAVAPLLALLDRQACQAPAA